ncbi:hypothetical protein LJB75_00105 [Bacteroidales bacterium OttesenSCG-928-L19]|nr:hypothetical protein [Bacteroidales bacterium OttesenSCG-928-L19]
MKKIFFLFIALSFALPTSIYCQSQKTKYGVVFYDWTKTPYKNQKEKMISYLNNKDDLIYQDKRGKIAISDTLKERRDDVASILPDSIHSVFRISNILKKKNNFSKQEGRLTKKIIYLIDIENIDSIEKYPQYLRLLSIDKRCRGKKKIKVGQQYEMTIFSFFERDCCRPIEKDGQITYLIRKPNEHLISVLYEDIWVVYIDISSYNLFETPNLKGLYYVSP